MTRFCDFSLSPCFKNQHLCSHRSLFQSGLPSRGHGNRRVTADPSWHKGKGFGSGSGLGPPLDTHRSSRTEGPYCPVTWSSRLYLPTNIMDIDDRIMVDFSTENFWFLNFHLISEIVWGLGVFPSIHVRFCSFVRSMGATFRETLHALCTFIKESFSCATPRSSNKSLMVERAAKWRWPLRPPMRRIGLQIGGFRGPTCGSWLVPAGGCFEAGKPHHQFRFCHYRIFPSQYRLVLRVLRRWQLCSAHFYWEWGGGTSGGKNFTWKNFAQGILRKYFLYFACSLRNIFTFFVSFCKGWRGY